MSQKGMENHSMVGDDEVYWQEYLEKTLPELKG